MRGASRTTSSNGLRPFPIITEGIPLLHEDDEEGDMGESTVHTDSTYIAFFGIKGHLAARPELQVCSNLNLYYSEEDPSVYVSPDFMVIEPEEVNDNLASYRLREAGPAPLLVGEVLSARTAQQGDLGDKLRVYAQLGIREYILIDVTGQFLPERLLLKRLHRNRTWKDEQDPDGGVTSKLGFRIIIDTDGRLRLLDTVSGQRYPRPDEAQAVADERAALEEEIRALEAKLARLRRARAKAKKGKGRRRKS
jgi:hypothetical protein